jgi:hypothetical protein
MLRPYKTFLDISFAESLLIFLCCCFRQRFTRFWATQTRPSAD